MHRLHFHPWGTTAKPRALGLRALAVAGGLLMAAVAAEAQCNPAVQSLSFSPSTIVAITTAPTGTTTGTVTMTCALPPGSGNVIVSIISTPPGGPSLAAFVLPGNTTGTFTYSSFQLSQTTVYTVTATVGSSSAQTTLTVVPLTVSLTVDPASIVGQSTQQAKLTLTANGVVASPVCCGVVFIPSVSPTGPLFLPSLIEILNGSNFTTFTVASRQINETTTFTLTLFNRFGGPTAQADFTVEPLTPTLTVTPGSIVGGSGQQATFTVTLNAPAAPTGLFFFVPYSIFDNSGGILSGSNGVQFRFEKGPKTFVETARAVATTQLFTVTATTLFGGPSASVTIAVTPPTPPPNPLNLGPCKFCLLNAGSPVNVSNGNVWIQQRDYSLPGLGGGLELVRTWNSLWKFSGPSAVIEMFGKGWRSTYEERLLFPSSTELMYWRSDGSAWTFTFNSATNSYNLTSPFDEHVSLIFDVVSNQFILTLADGTQRLFTQPGFLKAIVDRNGNQVTLAYDSSNRLIQATDAAGRILTFNYANATFPFRVSSVADATGVVAQYTYDSARNLTQALYADGSELNFGYNPTSNLLLSVTDSLGKLLEAHTYDAGGRGLTSTRANAADQISLTYSSTGPTQLSDSMGNITTYGFQEIGGRNFINGVTGSGCSSCGGRGNQSLTYDGFGNQTSSTDALGRTTTFTYDSMGNVLSRSIALDATTTLTWKFTYNQFQQVLTATDPLGNVTTNTYDAKGNLLATTTPSPDGTAPGLTTTFAYDAKGELTQVTDPRGNSTAIAYTPAGLIASLTDAQGKVTTFAYDARGNRTSTTDALANTTTFAYDVMNRLTKITQADGSATSFAYDIRGRRTSVTDANGKVTSYGYDDADRLLSVTDAAANLTIYGYDTENHLASITDALGRVTNFGYDSLGRVTGVTFPSTFTESYTYDAVGNLLSKTDRKAQTITFAYDALDRLTSKTYPDSTGVSFSYDALSRLTQAADPSGTYAFAYDNLGRLTGTTTNYSFLTGRTLTESYSYDAASNRTSFTDPEGGITNYTYDSLNRLTGLTDFNGGQFTFSYDALGRRTNLTRPNGVSTGYNYDPLSRLLSIQHQLGGSTLDGATYAYDPVGNRTAKTNLLPTLPAGDMPTSNYAYDAIYQLTQVTQAGFSTEAYSYDGVGNRLSSLTTSALTYNSSNELTSAGKVTSTYDANGNTTSKTDSTGTTSYAWDFENRLTSVTTSKGKMASYKYDPFGRRIFKDSPTKTLIFVYDGDNAIERLDETGKATLRFTQGLGIDEPLATTASGVPDYYEADGLGSITSMTDATGATVNTYEYDSFGRLTGFNETVSNTFRYTGREDDGETKLYYYRARYYDPSTGRFPSEDSARFWSGANFFAYVGNGSPNFNDPFGLQAGSCCQSILRDTAIGGLVGGLTGGVLGGLLGGGAGAVGGGLVGSVVPGPGTAAGGAVGATVGAGAGALTGAEAGTLIGSAIGAGVGILECLAKNPGKGKWHCTAKCNLQGIGQNVPAVPFVTGEAFGPSEFLACLAAKRAATQSAPRGTYARHCKCDCSRR